MSIDINTETIISAAKAAKRFGSGRSDGRACHVSKIIRLVQRGALEGFSDGSRWWTSEEALQRFVDARTPGPKNQQTAPLRTPLQRQKAIKRAERELDHMGV
jgi:hypothetical protein